MKATNHVQIRKYCHRLLLKLYSGQVGHISLSLAFDNTTHDLLNVLIVHHIFLHCVTVLYSTSYRLQVNSPVSMHSPIVWMPKRHALPLYVSNVTENRTLSDPETPKYTYYGQNMLKIHYTLTVYTFNDGLRHP